MTEDELDGKTFTIYHQAYDEYPFKDFRWQNNFVARARRIAREIDPKSKTLSRLERIAVIRLDIVQERIGRKIWPST